MEKILLKTIKLLWSLNKIPLIFLILIKAIQGFIPVISLLILQNLINSVQNALSVQSISMKIIVLLLVAQLSMNLLNSIISKIELYLETRIQINSEMNLKKRISNKIFMINYESIEDFEFQNLLQRIQGDLGAQLLFPVTQLLELMKNSFTLTTLILFLFQFHWIFILVIIFGSIPLLILQSKFGKDRYILMKFQTPFAREQHYIFNLFINRQYNKEIRLNQSHPYLIERWSKVYSKNSNDTLDQIVQQQKKLIGLDLIGGIAYLSSVLYLVWMIVQKSIKIGDFVTITEAIQRLQSSVISLSVLYASIKEKTYFIEDLNRILNYPEMENQEEKLQLPSPLKQGIIFNNFEFTYPGSNKKVLRNINFNIEKGSSLIIVGENGSGKTTLVKCLSGLYKIKKNQLFFDDIDINDLDINSLINNISVVHQDFGRYEFTAKENIFLGDINNNRLDELYDIAQNVEASTFINNLPSGLDTRLGRMFEDSQDLSGGQWQRIALARALIRKSQIMILDEPTAALDPETEINLFNKFREISSGKTAIFISHRMYSCHLGDKIIVMKQGEIVEYGTHDTLIDKRGEYYNLYIKQAQMYETYPKEVTV